MADEILKPESPKGIWLPSYLIYKQNFKKSTSFKYTWLVFSWLYKLKKVI